MSGWRQRVLTMALLAFLAVMTWGTTTERMPVAAWRHVAEYTLLRWGNVLWGDPLSERYSPGTLSGLVHDVAGRPVAGATVLVASPVGETFVTESNAAGQYSFSGLPPGIYRPVAAHRGYADAAYRSPLRLNAVVVRPGRDRKGVELTMVPESPVAPGYDLVETGEPVLATHQEGDDLYKARRRAYRLLRGGSIVSEGYLYEPVMGNGPWPTLLVILPGPVLDWEVVPVPLAAQGFVVMAVHPSHKMDIAGDVDSIRVALSALRMGQLLSDADTSRIGVLGGSFASLHVYDLLWRDEGIDAALVLGGVSDVFRIRRRFEEGTLVPAYGFDRLLIGLGLPNRDPQVYFRYSVRYHLSGLPPLCLIHGTEDEFVPHSQSELLAADLAARGMEHELHLVPGLAHYFTTKETSLLLQITMDFFARHLEGGL